MKKRRILRGIPMNKKPTLNRKFSYLREYTNEMPRFVTEYIIEYYNGESINTQIGYAIDIRVFLNYLRLAVFPEVDDIKNFKISFQKYIDIVIK